MIPSSGCALKLARMLVRRAAGRQLACVVLALACGATACEAHAGGSHSAAKSRPGVERSCADVAAGEPVALRVVAVDPSGAPLQRVTVSVNDAGTAGAPGARLQTDDHGEAEVGVLPGLWRIEAALPGYATGRYLLDLRPGQSCRIRFVLDRAPNEFEF